MFSTCYVNYNEPGIGRDLVKVLAHNEIPYVVVEKRSLLRDAEARARRLSRAVEKLKNVNIPSLAALARDGYRDPDRRCRRAR